MTTQKLSASALRKLKPRSEAYEVADRGVSPLNVRVRTDGTIIFVCRGRKDGKQVRFMFGEWSEVVDENDPYAVGTSGQPLMSFNYARKFAVDFKLKNQQEARAERLKAAVEKIAPVVAQRLEAEGRITLRSAHQRYLKERVKDRASAGNESSIIRRIYPVFGARRLRSLTRKELNQHFEDMKSDYLRIDDDGLEYVGAGINSVLRVFKAFMGWCVRMDWIENNPAETIECKAEDVARDRPIMDDELGWVQLAIADEPRMSAVLSLLLHTGCRLGNIRDLKWKEVVFADGEPVRLDISKTKTGVRHVVPLSEQARALIPGKPSDARPDDFVFPHALRSRGSSLHDRLRKRVNEYAGKGTTVRHWVLHDFRASVSTYLANEADADRIRYPEAAMDYLLSHVPQGVTKRHYNHGRYLNSRTMMLAQWSNHLDACVVRVRRAASATQAAPLALAA